MICATLGLLDDGWHLFRQRVASGPGREGDLFKHMWPDRCSAFAFQGYKSVVGVYLEDEQQLLVMLGALNFLHATEKVA